MPRKKSKNLTELELDIMQVLWDRDDEMLVEDIRSQMARKDKPLAPATVRTMLSILQDKGYLTRRAEGRGFAYKAKIPREKAQAAFVDDVVTRAFDGSASALVASLLGNRKVSKKELDRVKALIEKHEKEAGK